MSDSPPSGPKDESVEMVTAGPGGDCPFCDGEYFIGFDPITHEPSGMLHSQPMCEKFEAMDPDEYLFQVNEALGLHSPSRNN